MCVYVRARLCVFKKEFKVHCMYVCVCVVRTVLLGSKKETSSALLPGRRSGSLTWTLAVTPNCVGVWVCGCVCAQEQDVLPTQGSLVHRILLFSAPGFFLRHCIIFNSFTLSVLPHNLISVEIYIFFNVLNI